MQTTHRARHVGRRLLVSPLFAGLFIIGACAQAPVDLEQMAKDAEPVTSTPFFTFYSRMPLNLHDRLMEVSEGYAEASDACMTEQPKRDQEAWQEAVAYYTRRLANHRSSFTDIKLGIRYYLIGMGDIDADLRHAVPDTLIRMLQGAVPAYEACWWAAQDRANRGWIAEVMPKLEAHGETIQRRIEHFHQKEWPSQRIPVDAVNYVSRGGANTVRGGDHIQISVSNDGYQDYAALEMLYHEASHTIVGRRSGGSIQAINAAAQAQQIRMPGIFWHVVLFYTSGEATRQVLSEVGIPYEQYMFKHGPMSRGVWTQWRPALEAEWQPYLEGRVDLETAAHNLVAAIKKLELGR